MSRTKKFRPTRLADVVVAFDLGVSGTGGGCEAYSHGLPNGDYVLLTDDDGVGLPPEGGPYRCGLFLGEGMRVDGGSLRTRSLNRLWDWMVAIKREIREVAHAQVQG